MLMNGITIYEFDMLAAEGRDIKPIDGIHLIPVRTYRWLKALCLQTSARGDAAWLSLTRQSGHPVVQVRSFVGVIPVPGYPIEVLPKIGKASNADHQQQRQLLVDMLCCLQKFRHVQTESAKLLAARMPLLEVFIAEFLRSVEHIVKRGLRSDYRLRQDNLFALRGKLLMSQHLRQNLFRADRVFTEHDEFSMDRPENRLLHAALRRVLPLTQMQANQQLARELTFVFADVPVSVHAQIDFQAVRLDRGMSYYADALAWARLILEDKSPVTGVGEHHAPSLLFPMEAVFEAFVAKHLARQLQPSYKLKSQACSNYLVQHNKDGWFQLRPDLLIKQSDKNQLVLDTKWKVLVETNDTSDAKYGLSQGDFYQMHAYGQSYLGGDGHMALIYPKTEKFTQPLPVFKFPETKTESETKSLRLWVLPFCLKHRQLLIPDPSDFPKVFDSTTCHLKPPH